MLLDQIEVSRLKLAGTGIENVFIPVPPNANRVKWFAKHITSAGIKDSLFARVEAVTSDGSFTTDAITLFNLDGAAANSTAQGESTNSLAANVIKWQIQANAGANTAFYLRLKFFNV